MLVFCLIPDRVSVILVIWGRICLMVDRIPMIRYRMLVIFVILGRIV